MQYSSRPVAGLRTTTQTVAALASGSMLREGVQRDHGLSEIVATGQSFLDDGPEPSHGGRGGNAVTDHVADDQGNASVVQPDRVVPVTSGGLVALGEQVAAGDLDSRQDRQPLGQQGVLERDHVLHRSGIVARTPSFDRRGCRA